MLEQPSGSLLHKHRRWEKFANQTAYVPCIFILIELIYQWLQGFLLYTLGLANALLDDVAWASIAKTFHSFFEWIMDMWIKFGTIEERIPGEELQIANHTSEAELR